MSVWITARRLQGAGRLWTVKLGREAVVEVCRGGSRRTGWRQGATECQGMLVRGQFWRWQACQVCVLGEWVAVISNFLMHPPRPEARCLLTLWAQQLSDCCLWRWRVCPLTWQGSRLALMSPCSHGWQEEFGISQVKYRLPHPFVAV